MGGVLAWEPEDAADIVEAPVEGRAPVADDGARQSAGAAPPAEASAEVGGTISIPALNAN